MMAGINEQCKLHLIKSLGPSKPISNDEFNMSRAPQLFMAMMKYSLDSDLPHLMFHDFLLHSLCQDSSMSNLLISAFLALLASNCAIPSNLSVISPFSTTPLSHTPKCFDKLLKQSAFIIEHLTKQFG